MFDTLEFIGSVVAQWLYEEVWAHVDHGSVVAACASIHDTDNRLDLADGQFKTGLDHITDKVF